QVILNLLTNAEQALSGSEGERKITVSTGHHVGQLTLHVADTGPGIAAEHVQRIFNPFFTTKPVGEGTGLGLSISDGIVREHGGRIRVESTPGEGATFIVELPHVSPPACEVVILDPPPIDRCVSAASAGAKRLLLVEDEAPIR